MMCHWQKKEIRKCYGFVINNLRGLKIDERYSDYPSKSPYLMGLAIRV